MFLSFVLVLFFLFLSFVLLLVVLVPLFLFVFCFIFVHVLLFLFVLHLCLYYCFFLSYVTVLYSKISEDLRTLRTCNTIPNICISRFQQFTLKSLRTWEVNGDIIRKEISVTDNHVYVSFVCIYNPILFSSFMTYHWSNKGNTMGATGEAGSDLATFPEYLTRSGV